MPPLPGVEKANASGIFQQTQHFLLPGQLGKGGMKGIVCSNKRFLSVQDWRIIGRAVVLFTGFETVEIDLEYCFRALLRSSNRPEALFLADFQDAAARLRRGPSVAWLTDDA